jgi:hypothetical protein
MANHAVIERTNGNIKNLGSKMDDVFSGRASINLNVNFSGAGDGSAQFSTHNSDVLPPASELRNQFAFTEVLATNSNSSTAIVTAVAEPPTTDRPDYKMSRTVASVHGLWQEWSTGIGGCPSVNSLQDVKVTIFQMKKSNHQ